MIKLIAFALASIAAVAFVSTAPKATNIESSVEQVSNLKTEYNSMFFCLSEDGIEYKVEDYNSRIDYRMGNNPGDLTRGFPIESPPLHRMSGSSDLTDARGTKDKRFIAAKMNGQQFFIIDGVKMQCEQQ